MRNVSRSHMETFELILSPKAEDDLKSIYDWISSQSSFDTADRYIQRIEATCQQLRYFPQRGTRRDAVLAGLRTFGMERRVTIAFRVQGQRVEILRILYAGRELTFDATEAL